MKVLALFGRGAGDEVVENVEVPLSGRRCRNPISLQVVVQGLYSAQATTFSELKFCVLAETRGVGIEEGASVAETLEYELCSGDLGDQLGALLAWVTDTELE
jgi:hypothetical protein